MRFAATQRRPGHAIAMGLSLSLAVATAGCARESSAPTAEARAVEASATSIRGEASYPDRIRLPAGSRLRVQLIDNQLADTPMAVLADASFEVGEPPFAFDLPFDPLRIRPGGSYGLHASLRLPDGELAFITDTRTEVVPGDPASVTLALVRVTSQAHDSEGIDDSLAEGAPAGFLGIGDDGDWIVEVGRGERPRMWLLLDSGRRRLEVADGLPFGDAGSEWRGWRGEAQGIPVELRLQDTACTAGSGDAEFDARIELVVDGAVMPGCGRGITG